MSSNLGMKPIFKSNDKRSIKPYRTRPARQKYCRICGKPFNGGKHICNSCGDFIKQKNQEERTAEDDR